MKKNAKILSRWFLLTTIGVVSSVIAVGIYTRASNHQKTQKEHPRTYEAAKVTAAPEVTSTVKGLEITGVSLINQGTPEAAVAIDVTNKRDEDVMALDFIAGKTTYSGLAIDGLLQEDNPLVIIPRHSLKTFTWSLGAIMERETISLAAAVFADGKEEGDKRSLNGIKKAREKFQQKQREAKAKNGGPQ
ncbi:MAG TPA: hypothetical protein VFY60_11295 [Pyrinomonadaceae bacterium]|nr:hypothetical protein [Pyrinomonadaceae bacterium]